MHPEPVADGPPTGYPGGWRLWIHLSVFDGDGNPVFESGAYDPAIGALTMTPYVKVYETKYGLTPDLVAAPGRLEPTGETFHFVLNNAVVKDDRSPPLTYTGDPFHQPGLLPVGATYANTGCTSSMSENWPYRR